MYVFFQIDMTSEKSKIFKHLSLCESWLQPREAWIKMQADAFTNRYENYTFIFSLITNMCLEKQLGQLLISYKCLTGDLISSKM